MTSILHVELAEQGAACRLRLWRDDPDDVHERTLALDEIAHLAARPEADDHLLLPGTLREAGLSLFRWLDGDERRLSAEIEGAANGAPVLVLAIAAPPGLAHLPWEALHDGAAFLVHALNPPVLPVRWRNAAGAAHPPANRPLQALFMAASPQDVRPVLDHEREEHDILAATERSPLDLVVEESGSLEELGAITRDYGAGFFDVLHLTGHAARGEGGRPVFLAEDEEGRSDEAAALDFARTLSHRPPLVFLSGSRAGAGIGHGDVRPLAEQLLAAGFRAVLGWGRPGPDADGSLAARHVYRELAAGETVPMAIVRAHARLQEAGARDWHRLRLYCAGDPPGALVTPLRTPGRRRPAHRPAESEFLDPLSRTVKVATRATFVGRRRLLQHCLRRLRRPEAPRVGVLVHGQGGRGKSSVAARLCDRLRREFQRVVVIGRLDEPTLVNAWAPALPDEAARRALREPGDELRFRIEAQLFRAADSGALPPLFVLDDFEQNQPRAADGDPALAPHAADTLAALLDALEHTGIGRVLVTCRYALPPSFADLLHPSPLPPLDPVEQRKQSLRLERSAGPRPRDPALVETARAAADGNPRLAEWLHAVLAQPRLDHAAILAEMRTTEERFREEILARRLVASLPPDDRELLGRALLPRVPVPLAAVRVLDPTRSDDELRGALDHASSLGLVDVTDGEGEAHYRVPRQLGDGDPPLLPLPEDDEVMSTASAMFDVLFGFWGREAAADDGRAVELVRLAVAAGRVAEIAGLAAATTDRWLDAYRYGEAKSLLEPAIGEGARHPHLLLNLALAVGALGEGDRAGALLREAEASCPPDGEEARAAILFHLGRWLVGRGEIEDALRIYAQELLPMLERAGDARTRAAVLRHIADVRHARGEADEALRTLREEVLPVFDRPEDERERAVTMGEISDVLRARGELDEALRIWREEQLPAFERLGDVRERTMTLGKIADLLFQRGEVDEALRIRQEQLPVFERLGDVRSRAVTQGKIADILFRRGQLDEALRIRREEQLPVFERLGDARSRAVAQGKIADILFQRGEVDEALRIRREEQLPVFERLGDVRSRAVALGRIADMLRTRRELDDAGREEDPGLSGSPGEARPADAARGTGDGAPREMDEAMRVRLEEQLPVFDRLGDVRSRAVTMGKIADGLAARGDVDEALRIRREEQLPVFERLGDVRLRAVTLRKMADLLSARGEADEAVRILRQEVLPALGRLGDVRELMKARLALARLLLQRDADLPEAREHLAWSYHAAVRAGYREIPKIRGTFRQFGIPVPADAG